MIAIANLESWKLEIWIIRQPTPARLIHGTWSPQHRQQRGATYGVTFENNRTRKSLPVSYLRAVAWSPSGCIDWLFPRHLQPSQARNRWLSSVSADGPALSTEVPSCVPSKSVEGTLDAGLSARASRKSSSVTLR